MNLVVREEKMEAAVEETPNFRVAVRVRPLNAREKAGDAENAWKIKKNTICSIGGERDVNLHFDNLFNIKSTTQEVYDTMAKGVVTSAMEGIHGTVFAYGQTSSGKTHTMMGTNENPGVIPLGVKDIFSYVRKTYDREFLIRVSYLEIYQEQIRDLFKPDETDLRLHEHPEQGFYVKATEVVVDSEDQILQLMDAGEAHRHVGQTNMNEKSSRSHTLFRITIESKVEIADDAEVGSDSDDEDHQAGLCIRAATLNLVDLAGSERVGDTGAEGVRLKEAGQINKSLLTLGTVIKKLAEGGSGHIPYRDSQLTKLLQPSLGGNGKTSMICAVTPASTFADETRSTLMFADRAKDVKNSARVNEVMDDKALLLQSKKEIAALQKQLQMLQGGSAVSTEDIESLVQQKMKVEADNQALAEKVAKEASEKEALSSKLAHMSLLFGTPAVSSSRPGGRRASNPTAVATPSRRVTFGNYSARADTQRRVSVLELPSVSNVTTTPDIGGTFSKIKSFTEFQPMAAWDDDEDRDLGVLQEFEEQEEEEEVAHDITIRSDGSGRYDDRDERIEQLQLQLSESERTVANLKHSAEQQSSGAKDYAKVQSEVEELRAENEGQAREISNIEAEYNRVMEEASVMREQLEAAEEAAKHAEKADETIKDLQASLAEHKVKLMTASSNQSESDKLDEANQTIDRLERDRYEMKQAAKEQAAKLKELQDLVLSADENREKSVQEAAELNTLTKQSEKKLEAANSTIKQLQDTMQEFKEAHACTKRELKECQLELKKEQSRNDKGSADRGAAKLAAAEAKLKDSLKEKATLNSEKSAAQRETRDLKKRVEKLESALDRKDTTSGLKGLKSQVETLEKQLADSQAVQKGLQSQTEAAELQCAEMLEQMESTLNEVAELRSGKIAAETRAADSQSSLEQAQAKCDEMKATVASLQAELGDCQCALTTAKDAVAAAETNAASQVDLLHAEIAERQAALVNLQQEHQLAVDAKVQGDSQFEQLTKTLATVQQQADANRTDVSDLTIELQALRQERDELTSKLTEVETVAADAVKTVDSQQEELVALRQHSSAASGADKATGIEIADMQAKLKAEQASTEKLRKQVQELTEEMEMVEDDKSRLQDLLTVKERMVSDERVVREELEAKMNRITSKVKSTSASLSRSHKENRQQVAR